jgi:hypothetical protein
LQLAAVPAQAGGTSGGDDHRQADFLAEQHRFGGAAGDIDQRSVAQLDVLEPGTIVGDREMVFGGAVDELENTARQAAFGGLAHVEDVVAIVQCGHVCFPRSVCHSKFGIAVPSPRHDALGERPPPQAGQPR